MASIPAFNSPPVTYTLMQTQISDFKSKAQIAQSKAIGTAEAMRASETIIDKTMKQLADYVDSIASGDVSQIESTGFDATKDDTSPSQLPGDIDLFTISILPTPGVIELNIHKMNGGTSVTYIIGRDLSSVKIQGNMLTLAPSSESMMIVSDTHTKTMVEGLSSGASLQVICFTTNLVGLSRLSAVLNFKVY